MAASAAAALQSGPGSTNILAFLSFLKWTKPPETGMGSKNSKTCRTNGAFWKTPSILKKKKNWLANFYVKKEQVWSLTTKNSNFHQFSIFCIFLTACDYMWLDMQICPHKNSFNIESFQLIKRPGSWPGFLQLHDCHHCFWGQDKSKAPHSLICRYVLRFIDIIKTWLEIQNWNLFQLEFG